MRSKFFHAVAIAGIFALAGCSDDSGSNLTALTNGPDNKEAASDPEEDETTTKDKSNHEDETDISNPEDSTEPGESSSSGVLSSSNSGLLQSSSSESAQEQTYAFGYALGNAPRKSKGCGSASKLQKTNSVENGDRFEMNSGNETREFFITLPKNYDNTKPYKLLFAMHCMGSKAEDFVHHYPDYDHPSPYYGQQNLDKNGDYIFVAPRGDTDGWPWSLNSSKDHVFINELLTLLEENYCIDTTRVFATGFSFGAMFTNSLAWDLQDRLRAVAMYAPVAEVIFLPQNTGKPIAWMAVHGKADGTCIYSHDRDVALAQILKNNSAEGKDATKEQLEEIPDNTAGHVCHDFKDVDPRFPVKFCSWNGPHRWPAHDEWDYAEYEHTTSWQKSWVPKTVHDFFEQF